MANFFSIADGILTVADTCGLTYTYADAYSSVNSMMVPQNNELFVMGTPGDGTTIGAIALNIASRAITPAGDLIVTYYPTNGGSNLSLTAAYPISAFTGANGADNVYSPVSQNWQILRTPTNIVIPVNYGLTFSLQTTNNSQLSIMGDGPALVVNACNADVIPLTGSLSVAAAVNPFNNAGAGGSIYFGRADNFCTFPATSQFSLNSNNFTVECYFLINDGNQAPIWSWENSSGQGIVLGTNGAGYLFLKVYTSATAPIAYNPATIPSPNANTFLTTNFGPAGNTWYHVAVERYASIYTIYVNGDFVASMPVNLEIYNVGQWRIGHSFLNTAAYKTLNGYICDFRVTYLNTKPFTVYSSNFSVPIGALSADANTSLLLNGNGTSLQNSTNAFIDSSTYLQPIYIGNSTNLGSFVPQLTGYSPSLAVDGVSGINRVAYFSGDSDDFLTISSNTVMACNDLDWTIDAWVKFTRMPVGDTESTCSPILSTAYFGACVGAQQIFVTINKVRLAASISNHNMSINTWYFLTYMRLNNIIFMCVNGAVVSFAYFTGNLNPTATLCIIGGGATANNTFAGYLTQLRVVKDTALYSSYFKTDVTQQNSEIGTTLIVNGDSANNSNNNIIDRSPTYTDGQLTVGYPIGRLNYVRYSSTGNYVVGSLYPYIEDILAYGINNTVEVGDIQGDGQGVITQVDDSLIFVNSGNSTGLRIPQKAECDFANNNQWEIEFWMTATNQTFNILNSNREWQWRISVEPYGDQAILRIYTTQLYSAPLSPTPIGSGPISFTARTNRYLIYSNTLGSPFNLNVENHFIIGHNKISKITYAIINGIVYFIRPSILIMDGASTIHTFSSKWVWGLPINFNWYGDLSLGANFIGSLSNFRLKVGPAACSVSSIIAAIVPTNNTVIFLKPRGTHGSPNKTYNNVTGDRQYITDPYVLRAPDWIGGGNDDKYRLNITPFSSPPVNGSLYFKDPSTAGDHWAGSLFISNVPTWGVFTLDVWVYHDDVNNTQIYYAQGAVDITNRIQIGQINGKFSISMGSTVYSETGTSIAAGLWIHIAVVRDTNSTVSGYVNGIRKVNFVNSADGATNSAMIGGGWTKSGPTVLRNIANTFGAVAPVVTRIECVSMYGYISNCRIQNIVNYNVSSTTINIPTEEFALNASTVLLLSPKSGVFAECEGTAAKYIREGWQNKSPTKDLTTTQYLAWNHGQAWKTPDDNRVYVSTANPRPGGDASNFYFTGSMGWISCYNVPYNGGGTWTVEAWIWPETFGNSTDGGRRGPGIFNFLKKIPTKGYAFALATPPNGNGYYASTDPNASGGFSIHFDSLGQLRYSSNNHAYGGFSGCDYMEPHSEALCAGIELNTWTHIAITWDGSSLRCFVNGIYHNSHASTATLAYNWDSLLSVGARSWATNVNNGCAYNNHIFPIGWPTSGGYFQGYMERFCYTPNELRYTPDSKTVLMANKPLPVTPDTKLLLNQENNNIVDNSTYRAQAVSKYNARCTSTYQKYGNSLLFDQAGSRVIFPYSSLYNIGNGNFTVSFWVRPFNFDRTYNVVMDFTDVANSSPRVPDHIWKAPGPAGSYPAVGQPIIYFENNGKLVWSKNGLIEKEGSTSGYEQWWSTKIRSSIPIILNVWTHIAIQRYNGNTYILINGVIDTIDTSDLQDYSPSTVVAPPIKDVPVYNPVSLSTNKTQTAVTIGTQNEYGNPESTYFAGCLDNISITPGTARYYNSWSLLTFPKPTGPLTIKNNTSLLMLTNNYNIFDAKNHISVSKNTPYSTFNVNLNAGADWRNNRFYNYYAGDRLTFYPSNDFILGSQEFTLEAWVVTELCTGQACIFDFRKISDLTNISTANPVLYINSAGRVVWQSLISNTALSGGTWHHIAVVKQYSSIIGWVVGIFIDGILDKVGPDTNNYTSNLLTIGAAANSPVANFYRGYLDDLRISVGVARYNLNSPAFPDMFKPLTPVNGTVILLKAAQIINKAYITTTAPALSSAAYINSTNRVHIGGIINPRSRTDLPSTEFRTITASNITADGIYVHNDSTLTFPYSSSVTVNIRGPQGFHITSEGRLTIGTTAFPILYKVGSTTVTHNINLSACPLIIHEAATATIVGSPKSLYTAQILGNITQSAAAFNTVENVSSWNVGDSILLSPPTSNLDNISSVLITGVSANRLSVSASLSTRLSAEMPAYIPHITNITQNIKIRGYSPTSRAWSAVVRTASAVFINTEFANFGNNVTNGQQGLFFATNSVSSYVQNCTLSGDGLSNSFVFSDGTGYLANNPAKLFFINNTVYNTADQGLNYGYSNAYDSQIHIESNRFIKSNAIVRNIGGSNLVFNNNQIVRSPKQGAYIDAAYYTVSSISNNAIYASKDYGIQIFTINPTTSTVIRGLTASYNENGGAYLNTCGRLTAINLVATNNSGEGMTFNTVNSSLLIDSAFFAQNTNNNINMFVFGAATGSLSTYRVYMNSITSLSSGGSGLIYTGTVPYITATNLTVSSNSQYGISISHSAPALSADMLVITNNNVTNNLNGIYFKPTLKVSPISATPLIFDNNIVSNNVNTGTILNNVAGLITNNIFSGNSSIDISVSVGNRETYFTGNTSMLASSAVNFLNIFGGTNYQKFNITDNVMTGSPGITSKFLTLYSTNFKQFKVRRIFAPAGTSLYVGLCSGPVHGTYMFENVPVAFDVKSFKTFYQYDTIKSGGIKYSNYPSYFSYYGNGYIASNTLKTKFYNDQLNAPAEALYPNSSTANLKSSKKYVAINQGERSYVYVFIKVNADYRGKAPELKVSYNPGIGVFSDTILATHQVAATGRWCLLRGITEPALANGVFEYFVECNGTTGFVLVDSWSAPTGIPA